MELVTGGLLGNLRILASVVLGIAAIVLIADKAQLAQHYLWGFVLSAVAIAASAPITRPTSISWSP